MDANDADVMNGRATVAQHAARAALLDKARSRAMVSMLRRHSALCRAARV